MLMSITISSRISVIYRTSSLDCIVYTLDWRFGVSMVIPSFIRLKSWGFEGHPFDHWAKALGFRWPPPRSYIYDTKCKGGGQRNPKTLVQ